MPKRILLLQLQNYYPLYWKMKSSKQIYFINIRLFSKICFKRRFHLFEIFCRVLQLKYCIFSKIWPVLRHWHTSSEYSRDNFFFSNLWFALIIFGLKTCKTCKTGAVKKRKAKDFAGNGNKLILCNKYFGNYMKW